MNYTRLSCLFPVLVSLLALPLQVSAERLQVSWSELQPLIQGRTVSLVLPNGSVPKGRVLEVRPESLVLSVSKREPLEIDRSLVGVLMVGERKPTWRIALTILTSAAAFVGGMLLADAVFDDRWSAEGAATAGGAAVTAAIAGYYLGSHLDSRGITYIRVRQ